MAFFEHQFDTRISFGSRGGPRFKTSKAYSFSGRRTANKDWAYPLHKYDVSQAVRTNEDFEIVRAFFYAVAGAYDGFRYKDWTDYQATQANSSLVETADSPSGWQLNRIYTVGARTFVRPIYKPCATPAPVVRRNRGGTWSTATASVDSTTGVASITGHVPGDTYAWEGQFDVPVTFESDEMVAETVDRNSGDDGEFLLSWGAIQLEEIRL